jgi:hypothetical protein
VRRAVPTLLQCNLCHVVYLCFFPVGKWILYHK